jgi:2-polyprenyl-6-methoxyphenol hydroxylase-like FAD-dependent oxidoreductase
MTSVAIIGARLLGLTLALALHQQSFPSIVYESRPAPLNVGGAVMLSPNALKFLNALGVYELIRTKVYNFKYFQYRDPSGKVVQIQEFKSKEKYGFKGLGIYRHVLITQLLAMLKENNLPVMFGKKFARVVDETEEYVTWEFTDGTTHSASLLVCADGIHSTVRKNLYPDLTPEFTGMRGITAAIPTAKLKLPAGYNIPVILTSAKGAVILTRTLIQPLGLQERDFIGEVILALVFQSGSGLENNENVIEVPWLERNFSSLIERRHEVSSSRKPKRETFQKR